MQREPQAVVCRLGDLVRFDCHSWQTHIESLLPVFNFLCLLRDLLLLFPELKVLLPAQASELVRVKLCLLLLRFQLLEGAEPFVQGLGTIVVGL